MKIKPCPHCGGEPLITGAFTTRYETWTIHCAECGARMSRENEDDTKGDVVKAWNRRCEDVSL